MKLFFSPTSPYVRKVQVVAIEKGLGEQLRLVPCNPHDPGSELLDANPLGRVPTLVRNEGGPLFDSPVICAWLDGVGEGRALIAQFSNSIFSTGFMVLMAMVSDDAASWQAGWLPSR